MLLRKRTGGAGVGDYHWPKDGSTCEVPDDLGRTLLAIDPAEYEQVEVEPEIVPVKTPDRPVDPDPLTVDESQMGA